MLRGRIREDAARTETGVSLVVDVREIEPCHSAVRGQSRSDRCATRGGVRLSVTGNLAPGAMGQWRAGRAVQVSATLREPATYRNPGVPDDQRALARRGIALVGSVKSAAMVEVTGPGSRVAEWASAFRAWVRSVISATVAPWSRRSAGVAAAIVIGDRTGLAQDDEERLQAAGTYHVIAISGGNIAILTVLLLVASRWLGTSPRFGAAAAVVVLLAYSQVTGPAPSVDRAISAAVLFLGGRLLELKAPSINVLAVAATLGLASSPTAVFDPGFLLSFGATLGILIGVPRLRWSAVRQSGSDERRRSQRSAGSREVRSPLMIATVAAELALAPIGAALFGRVTCAGLLLNLAAIPLMTVVQAGSLAALGAWLIDRDLARACGYVVHVAARGLVDSARLVDLAPWLSRELAPPAWGLVTAYYCALVLALLRTRLSRAASVLTAFFGLLIVVGAHATTRDGVRLPPPGVLRFVFLDVGQGDATLLVFPDRRAFLIDAGGLPAAPLQDPMEGPAFDIGERVVSRALRAFGVRSLDTFVLTHADPDHMGGARAVVKSFRPRAIWEGVPVPPHEPLRWLAEAADRIGAEWRTVQAGDRLRVADVDVHVLHPPPPEWERQRVRNDDSVVLAVQDRQGDGDPARRHRSRRRGPRAQPPRGVGNDADHRAEGPPPRQRDVQHAGVPRTGATRGRDLQQRPRQPLRPPGAGRRRALSRHGRCAVLDRRRRRGDSGHRWRERGDQDLEWAGCDDRNDCTTSRSNRLHRHDAITMSAKLAKTAKEVHMLRLPSPLSAAEEAIVTKTIGCGIEVHRVLGPGFRERIYERALQLELDSAGTEVRVREGRSTSPTRAGRFRVSGST